LRQADKKENTVRTQVHEKAESRFDPIGVELVVGILGTAVGIVGIAHDFGFLLPRHKRILNAFKRLRDETYKLQKLMDDTMLTIRSHIEASKDDPQAIGLTQAPPTLSATLMKLRRTDYVRWHDIQEKLNSVNAEIYRQKNEIREALYEIGEDDVVEELDNEMLKPFDGLLAGFSMLSFGDLAVGLRRAIISLEGTIEKIIAKQERRR
jgi:hypothetical protein